MSRRTSGEHWYRTPEQRAERDKAILEGRMRGETYREIGQRLSLSTSRVCALAKQMERAGRLPASSGPQTWTGYGTTGTVKYGVRPGSMRLMLGELPFVVYANLCAMAADRGHATIADYLRQVFAETPELQARLPSRSTMRLTVAPGGRPVGEAT